MHTLPGGRLAADAGGRLAIGRAQPLYHESVDDRLLPGPAGRAEKFTALQPGAGDKIRP